MLKIKDSVDLKELEKFKFVYDDFNGKYIFNERNIGSITKITINSWNRKIMFRQETESDNLCLNILYNLIKLDMVEMVVE